MQDVLPNITRILTIRGVSLNFAGKSGSITTSSFSGAHSDFHEFTHRGHGDAITVSDPYLLFSGDYKRSGSDLILSKDGREHVVENYFIGEKRAALAAPDGARLSGDIVNALTGHVQYAQASGAVDAGKVIGHVTKLAGNATVIRNGVSIVLNMGDNVHKGDVVQSGSNSQLGITFIDGTVFGLASNARMVLNDMVYDPNGSSNSSFLSLVQGTITFLAGETAKHGDMKIDTPVATMGIRGTACMVEIDFDVQVTDPNSTVPLSIPVRFHVLQEKDGSVGSYALFAKTDLTFSNPIAIINRVGEVTSYSANGLITVTQLAQLAPEVKAIIDQTLGLNSQNPNNPNPQGNGPGGSGVTPDSGAPKDTSPLKDLPVGTPTPFEVPINFQNPDKSGQIIHETVNVTVTVLKKVNVTPVVDKSGFSIAEQVTITDSNPSDVLTPYVPGSGKVQSATGPAYTPEGIDLKNFVSVDPTTGHVSYDPAGFAFLKAGDTAVVTIGFDSSAGSDTFHESLTVTITGVNDAPVIDNATIAVSQGGTVVLAAENIGVTDPDSTSFTFKVSNVSHGTFQTTADGVTWVNATTFTTADLNAGHVRFVHDGGGDAPAFSVQADDGEAAGNLSNVLAGTVDFATVGDLLTIASTNGAITELPGTGNSAPDIATGSISFADVDPAARPTVSTAFVSAVYKDAFGHDVTSSLTSAQMAAVAALETALSLTPSPANTNNGSVGWTYQIADKSLDFLAKGDTLTLNYTAEVDDHHGGTVSTPLSVTITGANDAPRFASDPTITQLSVPANEAPFGRGEVFAFGPAMSADGRYVVFGASNQIPGHIDSSHLSDVYLYDRQAGTYKWISDPANFASSGITPHSGETYDGIASISLDGQYVAFKGEFRFTQTIGNQPFTFTQSEIFVYNTSTGGITLVPGLSGDEPSINGNGSLIASTGQSLTFTDNNVLVTDRAGHVFTRISGDANTSPVNTADISADGRYVTFWTTASQLQVQNIKTPGGPIDNLTFNVGATYQADPSAPSGPIAQIYVFDRQTETINLVSVSPDGHRGNGNSSVQALQSINGFLDIGDDWKSAISSDNRFILFQSRASNLVAGDSNGATDVFLYNLQTHQVQRVSSAADGSAANGSSYRPAISPDGNYIVFASDATNLLGASATPSGATGFQTYIRGIDPSTGLVSTGFTGFHNGDNQFGDSVSRGGGFIAFGGAALAFNVDHEQAEVISAAAGTIKFSGGSITDYNPDADALTLTVNVAHGTLALVTPISGLTIVGGFNGNQGTLAFTGSIDAINHALQSGVAYTPTAGGTDAITMTVTDGHGGTATQMVQFDPHTPQITGITASSTSIVFGTNELQAELLAQGQVKFSGESISDFNTGFNPGTNALTVTVSVGHGTLTPVSLGSGLTIVGGLDGHTGTLEFTGLIGAVNQVMQSGAVYTPTSSGPDEITIIVNDGHGGIATLTTQFDPQAPAIESGSLNGQYSVFLVDRSAGTAGLVVEDSSFSAPNSGTLSTKGAFSFTDADMTDTHTASVIGSVVDTSHAPGFVVPNGGLGTFTPLAVTEGSGGGQAPWTFTVDNALVQGLGEGQYITETYIVKLDDHSGGDPPRNVTIMIAGVNDAPVVTSAALNVSEGGTVVLSAANIGVSDPDNTSFTFTASNVSHGSFQTTTNGATWVNATAFTTADLTAGHVRFVHNGDEAAPTFSIQADDGTGTNSLSNVLAGTVNFTNVDDAPVITLASLTVSQGGTVMLTTADIDFTDPDSSAVTYTVSNASHGHFETFSENIATPTTTFTSMDVAAGLVGFVDDGSSAVPTFSLTADDGTLSGATVNGAVTFEAANYTLTSTEGLTIHATPEGATSGFSFPGAGNVTTPGIPEDRIAIGYNVGSSHVVLDNAPLLGVHQMTSISSETHSSGDTTFVSTTLDARHDVTLVQTLALGNDANFFTTTIDITNNGTADISDLRFLRNFDPDQDVQAHNDYQTFNDVVQKPDGAETFAIVSAIGVESHTTVAMVGLGAEWQGSVFGFTNTDPFASHAFDAPVDPDGALADKSLSLTSSLGTLTHGGGHAQVTYITTNNVATAGSNALFGTSGDDTINGLGGDDLLIGLKGADTFVFNAASGGSGHDTIADFTPGHDQISLDYHAFDAAPGPNDFSNWLRTHATDSGGDALIDLNVNGLHPGVDTILLKNVAVTNLQASDFHTI